MVHSSIDDRLHHVIQQIRSAEKSHSREPNSVELLIVSKAQSVENIQQAFMSGGRQFGENYLQDAISKIEALQNLPITWHFIGKIQRNKTVKIAKYFDWVQTIDSELIANRLNDARVEPLNICIQVNVDGDENKGGISPERLPSLVTHVLTLPKIQLQGLMTIPKEGNSKVAFKKLRELNNHIENHFKINLPVLSMGMTNDFECAIEHGATMVRLGTAIFGERKQ